jgi:serine protease Do
VVGALKGSPLIRWQGQQFDARVISTGDGSDLALLEVGKDVPIPGLAIARQDRQMKPGDWILVLGRPFGAGVTATVGIISAVPGAVLQPAVLRDLVQLNAAVNPGNSGGPVVDLEGDVIGVATAAIPGGFGLGFAAPVSALYKLLTDSGRPL